jgi:hypothetical protein
MSATKLLNSDQRYYRRERIRILREMGRPTDEDMFGEVVIPVERVFGSGTVEELPSGFIFWKEAHRRYGLSASQLASAKALRKAAGWKEPECAKVRGRNARATSYAYRPLELDEFLGLVPVEVGDA